jgi:hypothetical protein
LRAFDAFTFCEIRNNDKDTGYQFSKFVPPTIVGAALLTYRIGQGPDLWPAKLKDSAVPADRVADSGSTAESRGVGNLSAMNRERVPTPSLLEVGRKQFVPSHRKP